MLIALCEQHGVPIPEVNVMLGPWTPDFLWREEGLVVETDGHGNHHTFAQLDRDRRKELALRSHGLTVNRYSRQQVEGDGESVIADIVSTLARLRAHASLRASANPPAPSA
jgi:very-short-patch-repair endonuclease